MLRKVARGALRGANNILRPIDTYFVQEGLSVGPPLFIVGAPRSGTTLTYQVVTQQMQVGYFTDVMSYLYGIPNLVTKFLKPYYGRPKPLFTSSYGHIPGTLSPAENSNFWFRWFPEDGEQGHYVEPFDIEIDSYKELVRTIDSISRISEQRLVFKNVYLSMVVGVLAQVFADARFIFVRRNRIDTCRSLLLARMQKGRAGQWWSVKIPGYRKLLTEPLWRQVVDQVVCTESIVQRDLDMFAPDNYLAIQYEDLCTQPRQVVKRIEEWLKYAGYLAQPNIRVPRRFSIHSENTLSLDLTEKMGKRLDSLKKDASK